MKVEELKESTEDVVRRYAPMLFGFDNPKEADVYDALLKMPEDVYHDDDMGDRE
jgi:Holliday junction resolvasome RuvABC DNA-binding subunit